MLNSTPRRTPDPVKRFPLNTAGRDFVVSDIHGCFHQVILGLQAVEFDRSVDRLFSVGDTVDRGPGSPRTLRFLDQDWVHAIRGNHEDMFLDIYSQGRPNPAVLEYCTSRNGMEWWRDLPESEQDALIERFRKLPIAIEIETTRGLVGLVHAEVPAGMDWAQFTAALRIGNKDIIKQALWGRDRVRSNDDAGVKGIGRVFVGHTPIKAPRRLGNVYYLDTGAVFGVMREDPDLGRLTMAELDAGTSIFSRIPDGSFVDVRSDDEKPSSPFGNYAR